MQQAPEDSPPNPLTNSHWGLWAFTLFWCGISFPMAALFWSDGSRTLVGQGASGYFCGHWRGHGLVLLFSNTRKVWRYRGSGHDGTAVTAQGRAAR